MAEHSILWGIKIVSASQSIHTHMLGHKLQQHWSHFSIKNTQRKHSFFFSCFRYISPRHYNWTLSTILSTSDKLTHDVSGILSISVFRWLVIILTYVLCPFLNNLRGDCNWTWDHYTLEQDTSQHNSGQCLPSNGTTKQYHTPLIIPHIKQPKRIVFFYVY